MSFLWDTAHSNPYPSLVRAGGGSHSMISTLQMNMSSRELGEGADGLKGGLQPVHSSAVLVHERNGND